MTRTVLITGCSSGFGETTARLFAERGWNVVATMRDTGADPGLAALPGVLVTRLDVQDRASIEAAVAEAIGRFGAVDVLVNNAGFGLFGVLEGTSREKVREQFDVNVFGVMEVTRAVLPHMRSRRSGVILNISSGAGAFALPMSAMYSSSKFALEGFSEGLSYEMAAVGVTVKIIEPGGVLATKFGQRTGAEAAAAEVPADYAAFVEATTKVFDGLRAARQGSTSDGVAEVIYQAATDGTDQLRYVATDDIKPLIALRRETSEETYMAQMRATLGPKL